MPIVWKRETHDRSKQSRPMEIVEVDELSIEGKIVINRDESCTMEDIELNVLSTVGKTFEDSEQPCPMEDVKIDAFSMEVETMKSGEESCSMEDVQVKTGVNSEPSLPMDDSLSWQRKTSHMEVVFNSEDSNCVPKLGMEFTDGDSAFHFYNLYAEKLGFSVRIHNWKKDRKGVLTRKEFVCHRQGHPRTTKKDEEVKLKPNRRCGCTARIVLKRRSNGKLCVTEFQPSHNHQLAKPGDVHLLRSHRKMADIHATNVDSLKGSKVESHKDLSFLSMGCKNYLRMLRTSSPSDGDLGALMQYLASKSATDPFFFSSIQLDADERVTNIFWTDGRSRVDYESFGDVVCFDTTFIINNCKRPFSLFIGVNHHNQITIFAAALLYDQTIGTLEWLLYTFEKAMKGKRPTVILTDHDLAMTSALGNVWPDTYHRLCAWHIYQNASKYLSCVYGKNGFKSEFIKCVLDSDDEDSFLLAWRDMLVKHDLMGNEWMAKLFNVKEKWALPYIKDTFSADILTVQRSESMHSGLKKLLNTELNLLIVLEHYDRLLEDRRYTELQQDIKANQTTPTMLFSLLLREAARVYTPNIFEKFREEVMMISDCDVDYMGEEGPISKYKVGMVESDKEYLVISEPSSRRVSCSCKKFEFVGIQCCHALKVLDHLKIKGIPMHYILKRWTKEAKNGIGQHLVDNIQYNENSIEASRYGLLSHLLLKIAARASESRDTCKYLENHLMFIVEDMENMLMNNSDAVNSSVPNLHL